MNARTWWRPIESKDAEVGFPFGWLHSKSPHSDIELPIVLQAQIMPRYRVLKGAKYHFDIDSISFLNDVCHFWHKFCQRRSKEKSYEIIFFSS